MSNLDHLEDIAVQRVRGIVRDLENRGQFELSPDQIQHAFSGLANDLATEWMMSFWNRKESGYPQSTPE